MSASRTTRHRGSVTAPAAEIRAAPHTSTVHLDALWAEPIENICCDACELEVVSGLLVGHGVASRFNGSAPWLGAGGAAMPGASIHARSSKSGQPDQRPLAWPFSSLPSLACDSLLCKYPGGGYSEHTLPRLTDGACLLDHASALQCSCKFCASPYWFLCPHASFLGDHWLRSALLACLQEPTAAVLASCGTGLLHTPHMLLGQNTLLACMP